MNKIFLFIGALFLGLTIAVLISPEDHPGSCNNKIEATFNIIAIFPRYLHLEGYKTPKIQDKDTLKQIALGCEFSYKERYIPIDAISFSLLFLGVGLWNSYRKK